DAEAIGRIGGEMLANLPAGGGMGSIKNVGKAAEEVVAAARAAQEAAATAKAGRAIQIVDGFYQAEGTPFKFSEYYYNRLWTTGRGAPFVQAQEVLSTATEITPDRKSGFFRYTNGSMEMVYNPTTHEVWHLQPTR
ncbi:hypothetical protein, partial [Ralstonia mojiangensis]|uniref:hypothetical protein n=1 Tax=Ralstonia mojiangensis TaxID=2953895 RepID=UPI0021B32AB9